MILDVFEKADVEINGLDELSEWVALSRQTALIDTEDFVEDLITGRTMIDSEYRIPASEFNSYCSLKGVSARYARKHLYEKGFIRSGTEKGKINYTLSVPDPTTKRQIRCVCIIPKTGGDKT